VTLIIVIIAVLHYLDAKPNHFSPYIDLTLNVHWDETTRNNEPVDIVKVSEENQVTSYHLGFITDAGQCNPAWGGNPAYTVSNQWGKATIDKMLANKMKLVIALGGIEGTDISRQCDGVGLLRAYEAILAAYHPHGLEFNIENASSITPKIFAAVAALQKAHPDLEIIFTLHTLPEGLTPDSKKLLVDANEAGIQFTVNLLLMNYGPNYPGNMAQYGMAATRHLYGELRVLYPRKAKSAVWEMIEITPMIGVNDIPTEKFTLADADKLSNFAKHFGVGEVSMWLANRDFPCSTTIPNNYCSGDNLQAEPYEYERHFNR
jgi:hypothetical protein